MNDTMRTEVETLIRKAAKADDGGEAMRLSQAACNVANAMCAINAAEQMDREIMPRLKR